MATFRCEDCGKTFKSRGALSKHINANHANDELRLEVTEQMKVLIEPLLTRLKQVEEELDTARAQVVKLGADRTYLVGTLRRLNPDLVPEGKPGPKTDHHYNAAAAAASNPEKVARIQKLIEEGDYPNGFTRTQIRDATRANGGPRMGLDSITGIVDHLHEIGVIRIDRKTVGGAPVYKVVGA